MKQLPVVASFILFIALCVSVAYWGMQLFKPQTRPVAPPPQPAIQEVRVDSAASLFGGQPAAVAVASNYELRGVVMSGSAGESIAILSADGKPATATPVDREVMPGVVVKEVHPRYVVLSEHGVMKRVELPDGAGGQSNGMMMAPVETSPAPPAEPQQPDAAAGSTGGNPTPGYAGAPPVLQSSPQAPAQPDNGVINIPAPAPRQ